MLSFTVHIIVLCIVSVAFFHLGKNRMASVRRAYLLANPDGSSRTLPFHYGLFTALVVIVPIVFLLLIFHITVIFYAESLIAFHLEQNPSYIDSGIDIRFIKDGILEHVFSNRDAEKFIFSGIDLSDITSSVSSSIYFAYFLFYLFELATIFILWIISYRICSPFLPVFRYLELAVRICIGLCALVAVLTTFGIILSLIFETLRFFSFVPLSDFLFGLRWSPQLALSNEQAGSSEGFGIIPLLSGTLLITGIAMAVAGPIGLAVAIYMCEFASKRLRSLLKPIMELLAGIPTVVYGFFAIITIAPFIRDVGDYFGLTISSEPALVAGLTIGIMIIPFISSLSDDIMNAVPQSLRDASYALGSTKTETVSKIVIPAALPGIAGGFLLAISRAIGETMIVVMAAGLSANLTANPLASVTTITVQMTTLLVGDQEFDSAKTLAAFALGLTLFIITLVLNYIALKFVKSYRELYE